MSQGTCQLPTYLEKKCGEQNLVSEPHLAVQVSEVARHVMAKRSLMHVVDTETPACSTSSCA